MNVLSSLICLADGAGVGGSDGVRCWVFEAEQGSQVQSLFFRCCTIFKSPDHFAMHPSSTSGAPVAYSSTGDVSGTYWAGILGGRPWIRMYVARHQK